MSDVYLYFVKIYLTFESYDYRKKSQKALAFDSFFFAFGSFYGAVVSSMVSIDMQELVDDASFEANGQLQSVGLHPGYGSGYLSEVKSFQSGLSLVLQDFSLYGEGEIRLSREKAGPPVIAFFNCFSGVRHIAYTRPRVFVGGGLSSIEFPGYEPALFMEVQRNTPIRTLVVCMEPHIFEKLTGKSSNKLVKALALLDFNAGRKGKPAGSKSLDFAQKICGYQAIDSFMNNPDETLFLEAKALELVALKLKQLELLTGTTPRKQVVDHTVEKIYYACEILRKEMADPPGALDLARRVGLNYNQLVQGFKEILGIRPFEYLRTVRLEKARDLIANRECNVTEAAFNVGYSSLSHFTRSFRKEFSTNPKALAKEGKNKSTSLYSHESRL